MRATVSRNQKRCGAGAGAGRQGSSGEQEEGASFTRRCREKQERQGRRPPQSPGARSAAWAARGWKARSQKLLQLGSCNRMASRPRADR